MKLKAGSLILHRDGSLYLVVSESSTRKAASVVELNSCREIQECTNWFTEIENGNNKYVTVLDDNMVDIIKRITDE